MGHVGAVDDAELKVAEACSHGNAVDNAERVSRLREWRDALQVAHQAHHGLHILCFCCKFYPRCQSSILKDEANSGCNRFLFQPTRQQHLAW
jgi:hypothetical protein